MTVSYLDVRLTLKDPDTVSMVIPASNGEPSFEVEAVTEQAEALLKQMRLNNLLGVPERCMCNSANCQGCWH